MKLLKEITINGIPVVVELDTGAPIVLMGRQLYEEKFYETPLQSSLV